MSAIRLSICISTINRAALLSETLGSIASQVSDEVELIIVDSSSNSETEKIVAGFGSLCANLRYVRKSLKFDEAYCKAVELAQGEYCWLFTDDDLLKAGGVAAVLDACRTSAGLIIVNSEVRNVDFSLCLQNRRLPFEVDHIIARKHRGETISSNLALSCFHDNSHKGSNIAGIDPRSREVVPLFERLWFRRSERQSRPDLDGRRRKRRLGPWLRPISRKG